MKHSAKSGLEPTRLASSSPLRLLRWPEVQRRIGASRSTVWRWERAGLFPRRVVTGPRCVGWLEGEIETWLGSRHRRGLDEAGLEMGR